MSILWNILKNKMFFHIQSFDWGKRGRQGCRGHSEAGRNTLAKQAEDQRRKPNGEKPREDHGQAGHGSLLRIFHQ